MVDALKSKYSLSLLLQKLSMAKSSYYYQKNVQKKVSKYTSLRKTINRIFSDNYQSYGYRRIKIELNKSGIFTSEKIIRKLMKEDKLYIVHTENHPYSSYKGEITTAAPDLIKHNFHADAPNAKWFTDITQMIIPAGKMYLSAIVDCFDGLVVSWELGTTPTAALADRTLDKAVSTLRGEHPIIHSDRGCHYRWNSWLKRIKTYSLRRSMSRKGCSPDNAACEGFWGRLKNECFYGRSFKHFSTIQFSAYINRYIQWYNCKRVKVSLNGNSPMEYRLLRGA
ncbi:MAG: IS3 family transposase [Treponema sp.]|nr:IS3 family transposase [Treponema sp.]